MAETYVNTELFNGQQNSTLKFEKEFELNWICNRLSQEYAMTKVAYLNTKVIDYMQYKYACWEIDLDI